MSILAWSKKKLEKPLSAYVDGEFDSGELAEIGERVVFEPQARELLDLFRRVKGLVDRSVIPMCGNGLALKAGPTRSGSEAPGGGNGNRPLSCRSVCW